MGQAASRARSKAAALPGAGGRSFAWNVSAAGWVRVRLAAEADAGRFAHWLPVFFGAGVIVYFAAANEPALSAAALAFAAALVGVVMARRRFAGLWIALVVAFAAGGFLAAKLATMRLDAPVLAKPLRAEAVGRLSSVEPRANGRRRLTIEVETLGATPAALLPRRVRLAAPASPPLAAGDRVSVTASWRPPEGPVRPGGYDFARVAFFEGIGATGWAPKDLKVLAPIRGPEGSGGLSAALERLRATLTDRVATTIGGPEGAVAAALVTGVQGPIPESVQSDLRGAGLSHILSISGIHMALVAGTLFWLVRALLALSQRAALRWPVKGIAAAVALAGATFYLALSGAEVATQRSYVTIAVSLLAVLFGRPALAFRNFALAALLVMAWTPEAVLGPSFQMSFAAVAGLVAFFEIRRERPRHPPPEGSGPRVWRWLTEAAGLTVMTTLIAGLATAPFAAYHFQQITPYALAGNALTEPIVGLVVMPSVVGGLIFAPFGLDAPWWRLMGLGLQAVLAIAHAIASWPGSQRYAPAFGEFALILFALGIAWACLWRTALRWAAAPVIVIALAMAAFPSTPDVEIAPSGRSIAVRGPDGRMAVIGARPGSFEAKVWRAADGMDPGGGAAAPPVPCDALGCVAPLAGSGIVALVFDPRAFEEDCRRATLVVTRLNAPAACATMTAVIDRDVLAATGAISLYRDGARFKGQSARDAVGSRPWSRGSSGPPASAVSLRFEPEPVPPASQAPDIDDEPTPDDGDQ